MKSLSKLLLVGAVAVMAVAISAAPSEAAKRGKRMKAEPAKCMPGLTCSMGSKVMACGGDGKWYPAVWTPVCLQPFCPPKCG
jgi:hypothetical protein